MGTWLHGAALLLMEYFWPRSPGKREALDAGVLTLGHLVVPLMVTTLHQIASQISVSMRTMETSYLYLSRFLLSRLLLQYHSHNTTINNKFLDPSNTAAMLQEHW